MPYKVGIDRKLDIQGAIDTTRYLNKQDLHLIQFPEGQDIDNVIKVATVTLNRFVWLKRILFARFGGFATVNVSVATDTDTNVSLFSFSENIKSKILI